MEINCLECGKPVKGSNIRAHKRGAKKKFCDTCLQLHFKADKRARYLRQKNGGTEKKSFEESMGIWVAGKKERFCKKCGYKLSRYNPYSTCFWHLDHVSESTRSRTSFKYVRV